MEPQYIPICLFQDRFFYLRKDITDSVGILYCLKAVGANTLKYRRTEQYVRKALRNLNFKPGIEYWDEYTEEFSTFEDLVKEEMEIIEDLSEYYTCKDDYPSELFESNPGLRERIETWISDKHHINVGTWEHVLDKMSEKLPVVIPEFDLILNREVYYSLIEP